MDNYADPENLEIQHNVTLALRAHNLMHRDKDYVVKDNEVLIVDEFTGRIMPGRRYSDGLHQAIEAKEHVTVKKESKTLATITFQNFFNKFSKKAGMTGTAATEEKEFREIYKMDVVEIPTNKPVIRQDANDAVYKTKAGKFRAVVQSVKESHEKGQPVLVGTVTIDTSEQLSEMLKEEGIEHSVLNAKFHELEAKIVAQAGKLGAVTIATNMAGRGTDIKLGGNAEFMAREDLVHAGFPDEIIEDALEIVQLAMQEAKAEGVPFEEKLDAAIKLQDFSAVSEEAANEIKKRLHDACILYNKNFAKYDEMADAEGEKGKRRVVLRSSVPKDMSPDVSTTSSEVVPDVREIRVSRSFYISLEDNLMRLFGQERLMGIFNALGVDEDTQIEHKMLTNAIERAQQKIETNNYGVRSRLLQYDEVMNEQREIMYHERDRVLNGEDMRSSIIKMIGDFVNKAVDRVIYQDGNPESWNYEELDEVILPTLPLEPIRQSENVKNKADLKKELTEKAIRAYEKKEAEFGDPAQIREIERVVLLKVIDSRWMDHISMIWIS